MTAENIIKHITSFTQIYDENYNEINPIPENEKVTVYCEGTNEKGFIENTKGSKIGIHALIAKSWILHSQLKILVKNDESKT